MPDQNNASADAERVIELSKIKLVMVIAASLFMAAMGLWFFTASRRGSFSGMPGRFGRTWLIHGVGAGAFLFFAVCTLYAIAKAFDRKPGLVLGPTGIVDNSSAVAAGFIPWSEVTGVEIFQLGGQKMLVVRVADPEKYISRGNPLKRALNRANTGMCGSPVVISPNALRISFHELHRELASRLAHARNPAASPRSSGS
ncbi:MAG TPA: STM3941 family protein [Longimicrobium sp.]|nr:STM3941 family protein [Longimicrobium sp.]